MAHTEFYCNSVSGSNVNAGDNKNVVTSANGAWSTATNTFTAASGTPFSNVSIGDFASIYLDGATTTVSISRVTAVGGGGATLTVSGSVRAGTAPTTAASGVSCTVGGKWKGPNGTDTFPIGFVTNFLTDTTGNYPRINMQNEAVYTVSVGLTQSNTGVTVQGCTSTPGDLGKARIDGTGIGTAVVLFAFSAPNGGLVADMIFSNNGSSGNQPGLNISGNRLRVARCVAYGIRGTGINMSGSNSHIFESEAYDCNKSNTASQGGMAGGTFVSCISHDNSGSNNNGFVNCSVINCIADSNGLHGLLWTTNGTCIIDGCDFYNNGTDGIRMTDNSATSFLIRNCNFIKNGGWGIRRTATHPGSSGIFNCGFGAGTMANSLGTTSETVQSNFEVVGSVTYAADAIPWVDAPNGDFRLNLSAVKNAGRSQFTQTQSGYAGTVGYPDIGAAQAINTTSTGTAVNLNLRDELRHR